MDSRRRKEGRQTEAKAVSVSVCVLRGIGSCSCHEGRVWDACDQLTMKSALHSPAFTHTHTHNSFVILCAVIIKPVCFFFKSAVK